MHLQAEEVDPTQATVFPTVRADFALLEERLRPCAATAFEADYNDLHVCVSHPKVSDVPRFEDRIREWYDFLVHWSRHDDLLSDEKYITKYNRVTLMIYLNQTLASHRFNPLQHCRAGFIDGFTRFVPDIRAHDNNHAKTVLAFFEELIETHGLPRRVRGNYSGENILVIEYMEDRAKGNHNIRNRIGCLWVDFTSGVGEKWKRFFEDLEHDADLNPRLLEHIWLLRFLFLTSLNQDIMKWTSGWNYHKLSIPGERNKSSIERCGLSISREGRNPLAPHRFEPVRDPVLLYGSILEGGDRQDNWPEKLNSEDVDQPVRPFTETEKAAFQDRFQDIPVTLRSSRVVAERKFLWFRTLILYEEIKEIDNRAT
ncbi:hypothetical protein CVT25_012657 [Psilocybe cyanescens]|uniref:Integrase core domain-containing protein n=1 Tax=Psilocybe cyanescens TaxID=93625 RepID=A0A409X7T7_PSICY|nr:hypothetical protein CVT25_012657 [Psilocybe cyanescens]